MGEPQAGKLLNRNGAHPPVPNADKIHFVEVDDLGVYAEKRKEFSQIVFAVSFSRESVGIGKAVCPLNLTGVPARRPP
jgi:hypothetical protein